ncbi:TIGR03619 family F420-dependent LLM class oxidoreductase [Spongisporangium articulatum]|uniref:TIGR03619 family F420-dependent LLM class oxidoreductase n=1 Tax=Spongisporangium articulatum TaxID=3362603 RepID=A0ABW8AM82_9ACTN
MRVGFGLPVAGSWATRENFVEIATTAERLGYHSVWTFQRLVSPADRSIPPTYWSVVDPVVALGAAAALTERVELGVAVLNMPFFSPPLLAKQLAAVDVLSGGRLVAGLGNGWQPIEFEASGVPIEGRGVRAEEYLGVLRRLLGPDPVAYDGPLYRLQPAEVLPKPVNPEGIPILLGGDAPTALARAGRRADGWISSSRVPPSELHTRIAQVKRAAQDAGRDPDALRFVCRGVVVGGERTRPLSGPLEQVRDDVAQLAEQGVTEVFVDLNFDPSIGHPAADPRASMDRAREVLEALRP